MKKKNLVEEEKKEEEEKKKQSENVLWIFQRPFFTYSSRVEKNIHFHDAIFIHSEDFLFDSLLHPWNLIDTLSLIV